MAQRGIGAVLWSDLCLTTCALCLAAEPLKTLPAWTPNCRRPDLVGAARPRCGDIHRHQQDAVEYLREENRVLREMLGKRRLSFTDRQRRRLAIRGRELGRALLSGIATLVTPDTILT